MGEGIGESKVEGREENMAAWLIAVKKIRIQPYDLRPLGLFYSLFFFFFLFPPFNITKNLSPYSLFS